MHEAETMSEFLHAIPDLPACVRVGICDLPQCLDGIVATLESGIPDTNKVSKMFFKNLRAVCPKCCTWIPPETLSGVRMVNRIGRDKVTFTNYGGRAHLLDGHCVLDSCPCQEIVLIWTGPQALRVQISRHISRMRRDAQQEGDALKLACLDELEDKTVLDFTIDTIWVLWKNAIDQHLYLRHDFPYFSESPNLILWISVIPCPVEIAKSVFPGGYPTFLGQILDESELKSGKVSVAHWLSIGADQQTSLINLALASNLDLPKTERFLVMPSELVDQSWNPKKHIDSGE